MSAKEMVSITGYNTILTSIVELLEKVRRSTVCFINSIMTATYWKIGRHLVEFEQRGSERAEYRTMLIERLALDLNTQFKQDFTKSNLWNMRAFLFSLATRKYSPDSVWRIKKHTRMS